MITKNYDYVLEQIEESCKKVNRNKDEVTLIAVSKTRPVSEIEELYKRGVRCFGENKVQELCDKYEQLPKDIEWHMIGHLQRNKVKYIVDKVALIHSVDSLRLAEQIEIEAAKKDIIVNILIEVNVANEATKFGLNTSEVFTLVDEILKLPHIRVKGLMTIAPFVENSEENREIFKELKKLAVDIKEKNIDNVNMVKLPMVKLTMDNLSMGMTGDYQVAIEEGSTFVRVGTAIFGERQYV